jgi:hypothetical protein
MRIIPARRMANGEWRMANRTARFIAFYSLLAARYSLKIGRRLTFTCASGELLRPGMDERGHPD